MAFERWIGLEIRDPETYARYREHMRPILEKYGGHFRYDFWIAETLRSESEKPIERLFALVFPSREAKESFFADPDYKIVKEKYFTPSVASVTTLAEFER